MAVEYLGDGAPDGVNFGASDSALGFYGLATAVTKPALTAVAIATTLATTTGTTGFVSAAQTAAVVALANELRAKLVAFGLITT